MSLRSVVLSLLRLLTFSWIRSLAAEVAAGLGLYFNKALGNNLLYRFERGQYAEQLKKLGDKDVQLSSVYGAEHLLRLFGECTSRSFILLPS